MNSLITLKLPRDRVEQLRQFSRDMNNATMSATLGAVFKAARAQGVIPYGIPSVTVDPKAEGLAIHFEGRRGATFSFAEARLLVDSVLGYLSGEQVDEKNMRTEGSSTSSGNFSIRGRGNAVAISIPAEADPKMFTHDLALEFAELIERTLSGADVEET